MRRLTAIAALLCSSVAATQIAGLSRQHLHEMLPADAVVSPLGIKPSWVNRTGPGIYWKSGSPVNVHAPYYALHFTALHDESGAAWRFRVENPQGRELTSFGPADNLAGDFWTEDLYADQLVFVVESDRKPSGLTFTIDRWLIADLKPAIRSIVARGDPKIELIDGHRNDDGIWKPGRAVAKLTIKDGAKRYFCTGFMIGEDQMLTNEHCIPTTIPLKTAGACADIEALFNYVRADEKPSRYICNEIIAKDPTLDFAVVRLAGKPGQSWGMLPLETTRVPTVGEHGEKLRLIQHPGGRLKSIAIERCRAEHVGVPGVIGGEDEDAGHGGGPGAAAGSADQDFDHICDTEGGSSGSPVLDASGRVIGLHHFGFPDDAEVRLNQAVLMTRVVAKLPPEVKAALVP